MKRFLILVALAGVSVILNGCLVAESRYLQKVDEADSLTKEVASLQQKKKELTDERDLLRAKVAELTGSLAAGTKERDKLVDDNRELEKVLHAKEDSLSRSISELRQKVSDLEKENARLAAEIAQLQKAKEEKVREVSTTYESLLDKMKKEISQGQVTISELKGKLTVNMIDAILFDSGKAEVKPEGLLVLQKVIEIIRQVKDKTIRIEGHTDNVQIGGALAKKYPTNWELSAARAINVTRYLQEQGIDPLLLVAVANGEFRPVADNATDEGKAKNRRIEIVLVPKE